MIKSTILTIAAGLFMAFAVVLSDSDDFRDAPDLVTGAIPQIKQPLPVKTSRTGAPNAASPTTSGRLILAQASGQSGGDPKVVDPIVDESALRYFASKGDKVRLEAEIARLRAHYPNWTPPADPLAIPENSDRQLLAMWNQYYQSKIPDLRKAIANRQAAEPGWQPPADLVVKLALGEKRLALIDASNAKNYKDVLSIGAEVPSLLTCGDVDVLWRIAEAFAEEKRPARAGDGYSYILQNCTKPPERLATV